MIRSDKRGGKFTFGIKKGGPEASFEFELSAEINCEEKNSPKCGQATGPLSLVGQTVPFSYPHPLVSGDVVRENSSSVVYVLLHGRRFWVPSESVLNRGYGGWSAVKTVADGTLAGLEYGGPGPLPSYKYPAGMAEDDLVREASSAAVYVLKKGGRFWVPSHAMVEFYGGWPKVKVLADGALQPVPTMPPDGSLMREHSNPAVFYLAGGYKFWITSPQVLNDYYVRDASTVAIIPDGALAGVPYWGPAPQ